MRLMVRRVVGRMFPADMCVHLFVGFLVYMFLWIGVMQAIDANLWTDCRDGLASCLPPTP